MGSNNKTLILPLKKKWYDMIESGEKTEEYREIKKYWCKRLSYCEMYECCNSPCWYGSMLHLMNPQGYTHVRFRYGYTKRTMLFELKSITKGKGKEEWGAPNKDVFILKLGERIYE